MWRRRGILHPMSGPLVLDKRSLKNQNFQKATGVTQWPISETHITGLKIRLFWFINGSYHELEDSVIPIFKQLISRVWRLGYPDHSGWPGPPSVLWTSKSKRERQFETRWLKDWFKIAGGNQRLGWFFSLLAKSSSFECHKNVPKYFTPIPNMYWNSA